MTRKPRRFTKVVFDHQVVSVPWGFGQEYLRIATMFSAEPSGTAEAVGVLLELVGYRASPATIDGWPFWERVRMYSYCLTEHLRASDNLCQRHPRPGWLPEPWANYALPTLLDGPKVRAPLLYVALDWS